MLCYFHLNPGMFLSGKTGQDEMCLSKTWPVRALKQSVLTKDFSNILNICSFVQTLKRELDLDC